MRLLLVTDTHLGPGRAPVLIEKLGTLLDEADAIVHAGDITDMSVIGELSAHGPVYAVLGNNDHDLPLPEQRVFDADGCEIAVVHDSGPSAGRAARLRRWFPTAALPSSLLPELATPAQFADAAALVPDSRLSDAVVCGPDPEPHVRAVQRLIGAGFTRVHLHQVGPDQAGFLDFFRTELEPLLRPATSVGHDRTGRSGP